METMKKEWGKPLVEVQEFVPNEYCHSCWSVMCNYGGYFFQDLNGNGKFDSTTESVHSNRSHTPAELVILQDGQSPATNGFASKTSHIQWEGGHFEWDEGPFPHWESGHYEPDGAAYTTANGFIPAFWFKATRNGVEEGTAQHICDLSEGSYWPYKDRNGVTRPNHS